MSKGKKRPNSNPVEQYLTAGTPQYLSALRRAQKHGIGLRGDGYSFIVPTDKASEKASQDALLAIIERISERNGVSTTDQRYRAVRSTILATPHDRLIVLSDENSNVEICPVERCVRPDPSGGFYYDATASKNLIRSIANTVKWLVIDVCPLTHNNWQAAFTTDFSRKVSAFMCSPCDLVTEFWQLVSCIVDVSIPPKHTETRGQRLSRGRSVLENLAASIRG